MALMVYAAGPITGLTMNEATIWRKVLDVILRPYGIIVASPLRDFDLKLGEHEAIKDCHAESVLHSQKAIMTRDYYDCTHANAIVANFLNAPWVSPGTCMEIAWAYHLRIPIVAVMEKEGNPYDHCMMREAFNYRVTTIEDAAAIMKSLLLPQRG